MNSAAETTAGNDVPIFPVEPVTSMSETLAQGLVTRFVEQWRARDFAFWMRAQPPKSSKRAARFRQYRSFLMNAVPPELRIVATGYGDQSGREKNAVFALIYWHALRNREWLDVHVDSVDGRGDAQLNRVLMSVTRHALARVFQRLPTSDPNDVLRELSHGIRYYYDRVMIAHGDFFANAEIHVPTPHGALVVAPDADGEGPYVVKTWISDARLHLDERRLRAVLLAREERGFVVTCGRWYAVVSEARSAGLNDDDFSAVEACIRSQLPAAARTEFSMSQFAVSADVRRK